MAPLTRRQKKALAAVPPLAVDRISRLPDRVQAHILSFLPAQEAVRTCVLARTWRNVWKFTRRLLIMGDSVQEVREFVDSLLRVRLDGLKNKNASLDAAEIRFDPFDALDYNSDDSESDMPPDSDPLDDKDTSIVNGWMRRLLECQIQMLRIDISDWSREAWMTVNDSLLVSTHLTRLELRSINLNCRCLNLDGCPALEHLEIDQCFLGDVWRIMSLSLKRLVFTSCNTYDMRHRIRICVPRLVSLLLEGDDRYFRTPLLERMPDLLEANVEIKSSLDYCSCKDPMACYHVMGDIDCDIDGDQGGSGDYAGKNTTKCVVLEGLAQAKDLVLESSEYTYIFRRDLRWCPTFSNLKTLMLNLEYWCQPDCRALACILEHAPLLEKLTLIPYYRVRFGKKYEVQMKGRFNATVKSTKISQHLKTIEIKCVDVVNQRLLNVLNFLSTLNIYFGIIVTEKSR